jgi:predicted RNA-binding protein with PIN domain
VSLHGKIALVLPGFSDFDNHLQEPISLSEVRGISMDIIIDGYNLIGSEHGLRGDLEHQRNWLLQRLSLYQRVRGHTVVLVFDGWKTGLIDEVSENKHGVRLIFSRQGEKADSVIVRLARAKGSGCVVVTSDREVRRAVEKFGAAAVYADEFSRILRNLDLTADGGSHEGERRPNKRGNPKRLAKTERQRQGKLKKL